MKRLLRIATRSSALAVWQSHHVARLLQRNWPGLRIELIPVTSTGDSDQSTPLYGMGGIGVFCSEVQQVVLKGDADIGVHSLKDLPTAPAQGLEIVALLERADPRDALVHATTENGVGIQALPQNGVVASSSLRRRSQLAAMRPDLRFVDIRGNVQTRLRKISEGLADATILAMAGLQRMNLLRATKAFPLNPLAECTPAPGQGVIAIDCRQDDPLSAHLATRLNHHASAVAVSIERDVLAGLRGGCSLPLGCFAQRHGSLWSVQTSLDSGEGLHQVRYQGPAEGAASTILKRLAVSRGL